MSSSLRSFIVDKNINNEKMVLLREASRVDEREFLQELNLELYSNPVGLSTEDMLVTSFLNAVFSQKRLVFCMSSRALEDLFRTDPNWEESPTFTRRHFKKYLYKMYSFGMKRFSNANIGKRKPGIFYITDDSPVYSHLEAEFETQLIECIQFAKTTSEDVLDEERMALSGAVLLELEKNEDDFPREFKNHDENQLVNQEKRKEKKEKIIDFGITEDLLDF